LNIIQNKILVIGGNDRIKDGCQNLWEGECSGNIAFHQNYLVEQV
jgi:hypothetical protein